MTELILFFILWTFIRKFLGWFFFKLVLFLIKNICLNNCVWGAGGYILRHSELPDFCLFVCFFTYLCLIWLAFSALDICILQLSEGGRTNHAHHCLSMPWGEGDDITSVASAPFFSFYLIQYLTWITFRFLLWYRSWAR